MATNSSIRTPAEPAESGARHDDGTTFGEWLSQVRRERGLTLDDVCRETKIPLRHLEALEHDSAVLPAFYQRAEIRAIARAMGIDEDVAVGRFKVTPSPAVGTRRNANEQQAQQSNIGVVLAFGVMLAAAGLLQGLVRWVAPPLQPASVGAVAGVAALAGGSGPSAAVQPATPPGPVVPTEPDTPPPPSRPPVTELVVTTSPPGARITVNGINWGMSPVAIRHLPAGAKRIRATKDGFVAAERVLAVSDGERQALRLRLSDAH